MAVTSLRLPATGQKGQIGHDLPLLLCAAGFVFVVGCECYSLTAGRKNAARTAFSPAECGAVVRLGPVPWRVELLA